MDFKVSFNTDNAAFQDGSLEFETTKILTRIITEVNNQGVFGFIKDSNGNSIGKWEFTDDYGNLSDSEY